MIILSRGKDEQIIVWPATITVKRIQEDEVELSIEGEGLNILPKEEWEKRQEAEKVKTG